MLTSPTTQPDEAVANAVGILDTFIAMGSRDLLDLCQAQAAELAPLLDFWGELRVTRGGLL